MNFLPGRKYGVPSLNFVKKSAKMVTKVPDLTVSGWALPSYLPVLPKNSEHLA